MPSLTSTTLRGNVIIEADTLTGQAASLTIGSGATSTGHLSGSATLDFASTATLTSSVLTIAVPGAVVGDPVALGTPAAPNANTSYTAYVSAADTVAVRFNNYSAGAIDPASGTFKVRVFK